MHFPCSPFFKSCVRACVALCWKLSPGSSLSFNRAVSSEGTDSPFLAWAWWAKNGEDFNITRKDDLGQLVNYEPSIRRNVVPVGQSQLLDHWSLLLYRMPTLYLQNLCYPLHYYLSTILLSSFSFWCWGSKPALVYALPLSSIPAEEHFSPSPSLFCL